MLCGTFKCIVAFGVSYCSGVLVVSVGVFKSDGSIRLLFSNLCHKASGRERASAL